jgi:hypothetical protein
VRCLYLDECRVIARDSPQWWIFQVARRLIIVDNLGAGFNAFIRQKQKTDIVWSSIILLWFSLNYLGLVGSNCNKCLHLTRISFQQESNVLSHFLNQYISLNCPPSCSKLLKYYFSEVCYKTSSSLSLHPVDWEEIGLLCTPALFN